MPSFLFDILPNTGHVRITLKLASLLHEKGHDVYYTDSSDSVFTSGLLKKGIGRVLYPQDFRWFTPGMVLLDYWLKDRTEFYKQRNIKLVYVAIQQLSDLAETKNGIPVIHLPPSEDTVPFSYNKRGGNLLEWLPLQKKEKKNVIIIGLLEEEDVEPHELNAFYEVMKKACKVNSNYQIILLTNRETAKESLLALPENMMIYRVVDLPTVLPFCDVVLTGGDLNILIEGIRFNIPTVVYPLSSKGKQHGYAKRFVKQGLGVNEKRRIHTPERFEKQIKKVLQKKKLMRGKLEKAQGIFNMENVMLEDIMNGLIKMI